MKKKITRRDFLNGAAIAIAAAGSLSPRSILAMGKDNAAPSATIAGPAGIGKDYYPPTLTGIRGSHDGSFEVAHQLAWAGQIPDHYEPLDEEYDLVIIGGGISGLAAAYFYRQQNGNDKKVLILDNHDDFGGHAKRNEFQLGDPTLLSYGGSFCLQDNVFSDTVNRVMDELGVDLEKLNAAREPGYMLSELNSDAESVYFLNNKHFGQSKIIRGSWWHVWEGDEEALKLLDSLDLPDEQQQRLRNLITGEKDLLNDLSILETKDYIASTSYEEFLTTKAGLMPETIRLFEPFIQMAMGVGIESTSVEMACLLGYPGANSVGYVGKLANKLLNYAKEDIQFPTFPDGNASIARLLVRKLVPEVAPGNSMEDIIDARFDYSQLDRGDSPVRIRLNSTAVNVKNVDGGVEVAYVQKSKPYTLKGKHSILACYNGLIPHLCPELPAAQKENLKYGVKIPLVFTNVLLRSGAAVNASGPVQYHCPGSYFCVVTKAPPVNLGSYRNNSKGDNPMVLWMCHLPSPRNNGKQNSRDLYRLGRHSLYRTSFATYEKEVKDQLTEMFATNGFDAERDIQAITVNRWSHGYAYEYNSLYDPEWEEGQAPHELGRAPIGRISIANSDSEADAYLHSAIDAALRAVSEIKMTDPLSLQTLIDRATISDQVYRYTKGLDTRDWELIASLFSNPFHLHAQMLDVDRMMSPWEYIELGPKKFLPGFDVTAHLNTNQLITVEGNLGYIETRMYACHYINPDETISADQLSAPGAGIHCNMQMPWEAWLARQPDGDWLFHKIRMGVATSEGNSNAMETALSRHKD